MMPRGMTLDACTTFGRWHRLSGLWSISTRWHRLSGLCLPCSHTSLGGTSMRKPGMAARRGAWALARFLHRKQLPGEKEKNALAGTRPRLLAPKRRRATASRSFGKAFFSFSPALGTRGAQKRAKARPHFHDAGRAAPPAAGTAMPCPYKPPSKPPSCREWIPHRWHRLSSLWGTSTRWHGLSGLCTIGLHSEGGAQVKQ